MSECCATCAFVPGTEANKSELTQAKIELCLKSDEPFCCHERPGICAGFEAAYRHTPELPEWQKKVSDALLEVIEDAESGRLDLSKIDSGAYIRSKIEAIGIIE